MSRQLDEVEVTQYLRPNGRKKTVFAAVGEDYVRKAEGLQLSVERLPAGQVALYGKRIGTDDETELTEIATNGPGDNDPISALRRLIDRLVKGEKL